MSYENIEALLAALAAGKTSGCGDCPGCRFENTVEPTWKRFVEVMDRQPFGGTPAEWKTYDTELGSVADELIAFLQQFRDEVAKRLVTSPPERN